MKKSQLLQVSYLRKQFGMTWSGKYPPLSWYTPLFKMLGVIAAIALSYYVVLTNAAAADIKISMKQYQMATMVSEMNVLRRNEKVLTACLNKGGAIGHDGTVVDCSGIKIISGEISGVSYNEWK